MDLFKFKDEEFYSSQVFLVRARTAEEAQKAFDAYLADRPGLRSPCKWVFAGICGHVNNGIYTLDRST